MSLIVKTHAAPVHLNPDHTVADETHVDNSEALIETHSTDQSGEYDVHLDPLAAEGLLGSANLATLHNGKPLTIGGVTIQEHDDGSVDMVGTRQNFSQFGIKNTFLNILGIGEPPASTPSSSPTPSSVPTPSSGPSPALASQEAKTVAAFHKQHHRETPKNMDAFERDWYLGVAQYAQENNLHIDDPNQLSQAIDGYTQQLQNTPGASSQDQADFATWAQDKQQDLSWTLDRIHHYQQYTE